MEQNGIPTHFVQQLNARDTLVKRVLGYRTAPKEVIVRNVAAGSLASRLRRCGGHADGPRRVGVLL